MSDLAKVYTLISNVAIEFIRNFFVDILFEFLTTTLFTIGDFKVDGFLIFLILLGSLMPVYLYISYPPFRYGVRTALEMTWEIVSKPVVLIVFSAGIGLGVYSGNLLLLLALAALSLRAGLEVEDRYNNLTEDQMAILQERAESATRIAIFIAVCYLMSQVSW